MFRKLFNRVLGGRDDDAHPDIHVAAFGKHPGWTDHMEELGLDTPGLVNLRRKLYTEGISQNIDSGTWQQLDPTHRLERFQHVFVWKVGRSMVIGRLWSSSDGRGRQLYPMIVAVHGTSLSTLRTLETAYPLLEAAQPDFMAVREASAVRQRLDRLHLALRGRLTELAGHDDAEQSPNGTLAALVNHPDLGPDHEGMLRIMYQLEREFTAFRASTAEARSFAEEPGPRPQHIRVPLCGDDALTGIRRWLKYFGQQLHAQAPLLLIAPLDTQWIDVICGMPTASQLACLRTTLDRHPLTTSIPYSISEDVRTRLRQEVEGMGGTVSRAESTENP